MRRPVGEPMIVTALERNSRRRSRLDVYVDGIIACDIARATATRQGLRVGVDLGVGGVDALVAEDRRREALETAVAMLARRPRSERDVRQRLTQRKTAPALVDETVSRLKQERLLDDAAYARYMTEVRDRLAPRSQRLMAQELRAAGIDPVTATTAVEGVSDEDAAYRLASARVRSLDPLDEQKFRARLAGLLQRRGFGWGVIRTTVDRCWREANEEYDVEADSMSLA